MKKTERLFHLLEHMRAASNPVTAERLSRDLSVSERTIYRDVKLLISQGLPIMGEAGVGYVLAPDFDAPPLQFTLDELDILTIGLRIAFRDGDAAMRSAAETAFSKIRSGMKDTAALDSISLYAPGAALTPATSLLSQARHAIRNKSVIEIEYLSLKGETSTRRLKPVALLFFRDANLLAGYCELRQDFRNFRADRIEQFTETGERFTSEHFKLSRAYFQKIQDESRAYKAAML